MTKWNSKSDLTVEAIGGSTYPMPSWTREKYTTIEISMERLFEMLGNRTGERYMDVVYEELFRYGSIKTCSAFSLVHMQNENVRGKVRFGQ